MTPLHKNISITLIQKEGFHASGLEQPELLDAESFALLRQPADDALCLLCHWRSPGTTTGTTTITTVAAVPIVITSGFRSGSLICSSTSSMLPLVIAPEVLYK
jgi:hypothetical protein